MRRAAERQAVKDLNRKQLPDESPDEIPEIRSQFHQENVAQMAIIDARMAEEAELDKLPEAERDAERIERRVLKYERLIAEGKLKAPTVEQVTPQPPPNPRGGPRTPAGKAISSLNNLQHGLTGEFRIVGNERQEEYDTLLAALADEHQPATATELILVEKIAEHRWLSRRAQRLQDVALTEDDLKRLSIYVRYQTTNDRGFHKCLSELNKLKKDRLIGFESQIAKVRLVNAKALRLETDVARRQKVDTPPGGGLSALMEEAKRKELAYTPPTAVANR
jgi:hypothetical protein